MPLPDERSLVPQPGLGQVLSTYYIGSWSRPSSWLPVFLVVAVLATASSIASAALWLSAVTGFATLALALATWRVFRDRQPQVAVQVCERGFALLTAQGMVSVLYSDVTRTLLVLGSRDRGRVWTVDTTTAGALSLDNRTSNYRGAVKDLQRHMPPGMPTGTAAGSLTDGMVG